MNNYSLKLPLLCMSLLMLSGCAAILVGSGGAGGYYLGDEQKKSEKTISDEVISTRIKTSLKNDKGLGKYYLYADVEKGIVTLYGKVADQALANKAVDLTQKVKGVASVTSKIKLKPSK